MLRLARKFMDWARGVCVQTYLFLFCERSLHGQKWWREFKDDIADDGDASFGLVAIGFIILGIVLFILLLFTFAAFYKIMNFFSSWSWSFVAAFVTLAMGYFIHHVYDKKRDEAEKRYMEKYTAPL